MPGSGGAPRREEVDDGDGETRPVGVRVPDGRGTTGVAILLSTMFLQRERRDRFTYFTSACV